MGKSKPGPKPRADRGRVKLIGVRSSVAWSEWLEGLAESHRTSVSGVIDRALTEWARQQGHPVPPPSRMP
jgi:hypothetical protein